ncbi:hypothetical protein [Mechercharimyces sp. CAU 1602]|uniref:hypothetical protein n=1 Tax=Mechercharimyces sp. CAU 1602 TaxID=2973933 RepID=UPI002161F510|nr:hypothetical protein [Mechercharimyces sp. CAU 1602]MCS1351315.1 hypothetical protein [Mechercharimyces sp. CAU 1602]
MNIRFGTSHQYVFIHENVKHLLLIWEKETKKQLFIVIEEDHDGDLTLTHPGQLYEEMVLDDLDSLFFQTLITTDKAIQAVLGATFHFEGHLVGMYYERNVDHPTISFFYIEDGVLIDIPEHEYEPVAQAFLNKFPEYA